MRALRWPLVCFTGFATLLSMSLSAQAEITLCGHKWAKPDVLEKEFEADKNYKEIHRDKYYRAFQNEADSTVWTFTLPGIPAHPAVVCRRPVKEGDFVKLEMDVNCLGDPRACDSLVQDFRRLNAEMAKTMNEKQKQ